MCDKLSVEFTCDTVPSGVVQVKASEYLSQGNSGALTLYGDVR